MCQSKFLKFRLYYDKKHSYGTSGTHEINIRVEDVPYKISDFKTTKSKFLVKD